MPVYCTLPVNIQGMDFERLDSDKDLGHLNYKLDWTTWMYRKEAQPPEKTMV